MKSAGEIMEILEAFDLTASYRDAGELAGCSHHTVARYVSLRDAGGLTDGPAARPQLIDPYLPKVEEWVEKSKGKIRADVAHRKLKGLGFKGSERTTRRAVAQVKGAFKQGRVRVHRPWITEPGLWLQYDFGDGPVIDGVKTTLFCAWLAWSRFRVVLPLRDKTLPSVMAALDVTLRRLGGAPTYVLTDNEKTVTVEHIAGLPVRNPQIVAFARHYGVTVHTCEPADPASKGGSENTVKLAKADLVPTETNLLEAYGSFAELELACEQLCEELNTRTHRLTRRAPVEMLAEERSRLHPLPSAPHTVAFGLTRTVGATSPMVRSRVGSTRSRTPCSGRPSGSGSTGCATAVVRVSRSCSCTSGRPVRSRSPGTCARPRAPRGSTTATSRPLRRGRWTGSRGRETLQSRSSWASGWAPGCG